MNHNSIRISNTVVKHISSNRFNSVVQIIIDCWNMDCSVNLINVVVLSLIMMSVVITKWFLINISIGNVVHNRIYNNMMMIEDLLN